MRPAAEGHVLPGVRPGDVEFLGGGPPERLVVIGRGQHRDDEGARRDHPVPYGPRLLDGDPSALLHGIDVTQEFLHRVGGQIRGAAEQGELLGVPQQRLHPAGDQVHRGLVAGDEQQLHLRDHFFVGEPVALLLRLDQRGEQVVRGMRTFVGDRVGDDRVEFGRRPLDGLELPVVRDDVERADDLAAQVADVRGVRLRHAEHPRDHLERQRERQHVDQVRLPVPGYTVERVVHEPGDQRLQRGDRTPCEHLRHQRAQPGVIRRITVEHGQGPPLDEPHAERAVLHVARVDRKL